jgi:hypothetical protein
VRSDPRGCRDGHRLLTIRSSQCHKTSASSGLNAAARPMGMRTRAPATIHRCPWVRDTLFMPRGYSTWSTAPDETFGLPPPLVMRVTQTSGVNRLPAAFDFADCRHRIHPGKGSAPISEAVVVPEAEPLGPLLSVASRKRAHLCTEVTA